MHKNTIVFDSRDLVEKSLGLRFELPQLGEFATGFVVRYHGIAHAYVNQCAHVAVELDWNQGEFFTLNKEYIICATHGAHYRPDNGFCVMGPCKGKSLQALPVTEQNQQISIHLDHLHKSIRKT
jgi:nitrite reductase/ring-hydroxylating ferredoxin subunit